MTFTARILECGDDESKPSRWTLCRPGERFRVEIRWRDEAGLAREPPLVHLAYSWNYEWTTFDVDLPRRIALESRVDDTWSARVELACPSFMPMLARIGLNVGGQSLQTSIRLIPRISAVLSTFVVLAGIVFGAYTTNHVFTSLRVTWGDALATLGGVSLITVVAGLIKTMVARAWPGTLPMLGIPYLVHRALLATGLGLVLLMVFVRTQVTSLVNETEAKVALHVPGWEREEPLPNQEIVSFLRRPEDVEQRLSAYIEGSERFCPVVIVGDEEVDSNGECRTMADGGGTTPLGRFGFSPEVIALRCAKTKWAGISKNDVISQHSSSIELSDDDDSVWVLPNEKCEIEDSIAMGISIEGFVSNGYEGVYEATYPWRPSHSKPEDVVDLTIWAPNFGATVPHLRVLAKDDPSKRDSLRATTVGLVGAASNVRRGVKVPRVAKLPALEIEVGVPGRKSTEFEPESTLTCSKLTSSLTSIHAVGIDVPRGRDQVIALDASYNSVWQSTWAPRGLNSTLTRGLVWICVGLSDLSDLSDIRLGTLKVEVGVSPTAALPYLELQSAWLQDLDIVAVASEPTKPAEPGTLRCKSLPTATTSVRIGPVKVDGKRNWTGKVILDGHDWASEWVPQKGDSFPWVCWPANLPSGPVDVEVDDGGEVRSGTFDPDVGELTLHPKTCWLVKGHLHTTEPRRGCKSDPKVMAQYFRSKGNDQSCDTLKICD